ncbi:Pyridoxal phosphate phosphatase [Thelohanellus kitauei]|uniref:Pyridoxal phosphate phosphatase n=1 Tax=Thelohanellus kitauei TaxID=669202 RepID=A0A0C2ML59_THEKT|nr:Pyridoxal phosphate phosphatase [Thelohanellus kitauei]
MKDAKFKKSAFIVGSKGLAHEINLRGIRTVMQVGAVVVGLDRNINYWKIAHAVNYLTNPSVLFIGTNPDTALPAPNNRLLPCEHISYQGSGAMIAAVQAASGRTPLLLGKPSKHAFDVLRDEFELDPETTCMVGDRLETDILFGRRGGTKTALVFSGFTTKENYEKLKSESEAGKDVSDVFCEPHATFDSLKHLVDSLFQ